MTSTPFPTLLLDPEDDWEWPAPPFEWRYTEGDGQASANPCRILTTTGPDVLAQLIRVDLAGANVIVRQHADAPELSVPLSRIRQLTLLEPLRPLDPQGRSPLSTLPLVDLERPCTVQFADTAEPWVSRTVGHVRNESGLYLFEPVEGDLAVRRHFFPSTASIQLELGPSAREVAASCWIATREELLALIDHPQLRPVLRTGDSLLELGLITRGQLARALAEEGQANGVPLGQRLVNAGLVSEGDLQTALAHKVGMPLVDLTRFPIEAAAMRVLPVQAAVEAQAVPLIVEGKRLVVAVDRLTRIEALKGLRVFSDMRVVPVLASTGQIKTALTGMAHSDSWAMAEAVRPRQQGGAEGEGEASLADSSDADPSEGRET